eukprot:3351561-Pleurochrysis_carterae.AAC.2
MRQGQLQLVLGWAQDIAKSLSQRHLLYHTMLKKGHLRRAPSRIGAPCPDVSRILNYDSYTSRLRAALSFTKKL